MLLSYDIKQERVIQNVFRVEMFAYKTLLNSFQKLRLLYASVSIILHAWKQFLISSRSIDNNECCMKSIDEYLQVESLHMTYFAYWQSH